MGNIYFGSRSQFEIYCSENPISWRVKEFNLQKAVFVHMGGEATIYKVVSQGKSRIAKRFDREPSSWFNPWKDRSYEVQILLYLDRRYPGMVPKVFDWYRDQNGNEILILEKLYPFVYSDESAQILFRDLENLKSEGIKHGDISPGNILQGKNGRPKWIDFSRLALILGPYGFGTPGYSLGKSDEEALHLTLDQCKLESATATIIGVPPHDMHDPFIKLYIHHMYDVSIIKMYIQKIYDVSIIKMYDSNGKDATIDRLLKLHPISSQ